MYYKSERGCIMHSEKISPDTVKITISAAELRKAGLTPHELSLKCPETADALSAAIIEFFPDEEPCGKDISVDVIASKDGGVIMYVSTGSYCPVIKRRVFTCSSTDVLRELCGVLRKLELPLKSSVLTAGADTIHLTADAPIRMKLPKGVNASDADSVTEAYLNEHDRMIFPRDAVSLMLSS